MAPIDERMSLGLELASQLMLTSDAPVELPFGGMTGAHVVQLKSVGGPLTVTLSTATDFNQVITVDSFALLMSASAPYTEITVQRSPGVVTFCKFFLGQRAG